MWWRKWPFYCFVLSFLISALTSTAKGLQWAKEEYQIGNLSSVNFNNKTQLRGIKMPCSCQESECGCCTGNILQNFNINMRHHFCINMTYEPEDLSIGVKMSIDDLVLLSRRVSGRNPPPFCVNFPRINFVKFCGKLTNVYFVGRNIHACITLETEWNHQTVFTFSFDCIRIGMDGVAVLPAEAGGGLPHPIDQEEDNIEEYDELLENQSTPKPSNNLTQTSTMKATTVESNTTIATIINATTIKDVITKATTTKPTTVKGVITKPTTTKPTVIKDTTTMATVINAITIKDIITKATTIKSTAIKDIIIKASTTKPTTMKISTTKTIS